MQNKQHQTRHRPFFQWVVDHPWNVLAISVILIAAVGSGGRFLAFNSDYRVFFSKENPQLKAFDALEARFTKNDNVLFVLAPKNKNVFTPRTLQAVRSLTDKAWQLPFSIRVDSISNYQYSYANGDELIVEDLIGDDVELTAQHIKHIRDIALSEPLLVNRIISPTGHVTGVNVTIQFNDNRDINDVPKVAAHARALADEIRQAYPDLDVYLSGMVLMDNAFSEASMLDMQTLVPLSFLVILLSLGFLMKGWTGTLASFWVIVLSIMGGMGVAGWAGLDITPPSASAPTIILTLAVANAVHVLVTFFQGLRKGEPQRQAMLESMRINLQPVLLTSVTTALGFLSMNFSDAPPFRDLGNIVAVGVAFSFALSMTFLPALMQVLPVRVKAGAGKDGGFMEAFGEFVVRRHKALLVSMLVLVLGLIALIPRNELNDQFVKYFDKRVQFRVDSDFVSDNLGGLYKIDYSLSSGEPGGVSAPAFLQKVQDFAQWYSAQPEVVHVNAFTDTIKRLNKNMHADDPAYYRLPESRELAAQYILLYEMSLPKGLDLNDQIDVGKSATRLSVTTQVLSTSAMLALEDRAQAWLARHAPGMQSGGSGPTMMFSHIARRNINGMLLGTTLALVLISMILMFALRSLRIGMVSLIPNLVPAAMAFGIWGLFVGEVGLSLSVVVGMTLGIVVDDTVHFLSKYLRARREFGHSSEDAVRYAFTTVGKALWITSVVLIAGFLVLAMSSFKLNSGMGILTAITIALALLADFLFLPALLIKIDGGRARDTQPQSDLIAEPLNKSA